MLFRSYVICADYHRAWMGMRTFITKEARLPEVGDMILAMSDALICAQNMVVAAQALGLGSCYIGDILENYEFHKDLLKLPTAVWPICMLVLGYPTQHQLDRVKPKRFDPKFVMHTNTYQVINADEHQVFVRSHLKDSQRMQTEYDYYKDLYERKYSAEFTIEMNRSVKVMLDSLDKS